MPHKRIYGPTYPVVYDKWEADGVNWIIQDLPPEDDEEAVKILVDNLCPDETLCALSELMKDPESVRGISEFWRYYLNERMSLGCYVEEGGTKKLVALNVCLVTCEGEHDEVEIVGEKWKNVYDVLCLMEEKEDAFKYLGLDKLLYAMGLVVKREYRGSKLGAKVLAARRGLALSQGLKGTSTVFTGIASQKVAYMCGFECIAEAPIKHFAELGLKYPKDDETLIKLMVKKFE
ncbi:hypothetical protein K1T71_003548 [Dendrolimus kikuchii]|uniref:Uncharacterized protein n=1 Tax=Dendrolimus kikuchii TaxID=765133 RepID=A0ACC1DBZ5_9NEOP|nr:hypothetical protein K1T71_003548 [Dendrolimus kikuchii]